MNISIDLKKKLFSQEYDVNIHVGCTNKLEAESIEVSFIQMLSQIRSCDFTTAEEVGDSCQSNKKAEEEDETQPIGFINYVVGEDDGNVAGEDDYEYEEEE